MRSPAGVDPTQTPANRLVFALDYGTTYTGFAWCESTSVTDVFRLEDIKVHQDWPGIDGSSNEVKVPSVISYSPAPDAASQWGNDISPKSETIKWTKLELDPRDKIEELKSILRALDSTKNLDLRAIQKLPGGIPPGTTKDSVEIATEYLARFRKHVMRSLQQGDHINEDAFSRIPIDLVVTIPAVWSESALNRTFRAINDAGFNVKQLPTLRRTFILSEAEATAFYILNHLNESEDMELMVGDCFVVCDAGGGTVDLVSYRIVELEPTFRTEQIGTATGDRCGASFIDLDFQNWLKKKLGPKYYAELAKDSPDEFGAHTVVSSNMRAVINGFETIKKQFGKPNLQDPEYIPLPAGVNFEDDQMKGIQDGELLITRAEIKQLFRPWVDRVIDLIAGQITQVDLQRSMVRTIFLSGGFAESDFLLKEVREFTRLRRIQVDRGPHSWSAVARGAVAKALGRGVEGLTWVRPCPRHFGVITSQAYSAYSHASGDVIVDHVDGRRKAKEQVAWLIRKDDALLSDKPKVITSYFTRTFTLQDRSNFQTTFIALDDKYAPEQYSQVPQNRSVVTAIPYDLSRIPPEQFTQEKHSRTNQRYYTANLEIRVTIDTNVKVSIFFKNTELKTFETSLEA
ncbi:actin-like ATPase domain-containing protein [Patellaria atrata CBS 101060]|uniref:Actin-like ATPase domain-containing protein n=1 Tax=Patellaria atrata CBS 101060 TaxID=1346257 RepID=A0A9P4S8G0_9PEZI|nr:actin-like ATPase domain-containing protein [Patellaria atrata CBS 101060]